MGQGGSSGISIDLASLRFFADSFKSETEAVQDGVDRAKHQALATVPFGQRHASGEVKAGVEAVDAALDRARANTAAQVQAAEILINAAQHILTTYANVDLESAEQLAVVNWTLSEAVRESEAVYRPQPIPRGMLP